MPRGFKSAEHNFQRHHLIFLLHLGILMKTQPAARLAYGQRLIILNFEDPSFGSATDLNKLCLWGQRIEDPCFYIVQIPDYNCAFHQAKSLCNVSFKKWWILPSNFMLLWLSVDSSYFLLTLSTSSDVLHWVHQVKVTSLRPVFGKNRWWLMSLLSENYYSWFCYILQILNLKLNLHSL